MRVFKSDSPKVVTDSSDVNVEYIKSIHNLVTTVPADVIEYSYLLNVLREAALIVETMNDVTGGQIFDNSTMRKLQIIDAAAASIKCSDCETTIKAFSMLYDTFLA